MKSYTSINRESNGKWALVVVPMADGESLVWSESRREVFSSEADAIAAARASGSANLGSYTPMGGSKTLDGRDSIGGFPINGTCCDGADRDCPIHGDGN